MKLFIFAGEASGDLHGSRLLKALFDVEKNLTVEGVAGPLMRKENISTFMKTENFSVMGFTDVFLALPSLIKKFYTIRDHILKTKPDGVVLIDYPGFNLRLASHLRKKGYLGKIIQYISPTVWAWGKRRIHTMNRTLDLLLTIYPFEKEYFSHLPLYSSKVPLKIEYVGHPLQETLQNYAYTPFEKKKESPLIAVFPGSREGEIKRNFPKILESLNQIKNSVPNAIFAISTADDRAKEFFLRHLNEKENRFLLVPKEKRYELMWACDAAIAKSGTVALELALHKKPSVIMYELSFLNRFIATYILRLKLPFYCIVNILKKKQVFKEFIEKKSTPQKIAEEVKELIFNAKKRQDCIQACEEIHDLLKEKDGSKRAALSILKELSC
ncbi:MAG TPA: lipid-A-disaccharide synthase [Parachlamydiaceae bacterium]|nr:lipid-A-disaccharide synthase [Parachlamydiaceae bacterium]